MEVVVFNLIAAALIVLVLSYRRIASMRPPPPVYHLLQSVAGLGAFNIVAHDRGAVIADHMTAAALLAAVSTEAVGDAVRGGEGPNVLVGPTSRRSLGAAVCSRKGGL